MSVKETLPTLLPPFCPERHINNDGTFCMSWREVDDLTIVDRPSAEHWFQTLIRFLQLQVRAARKRCWPNNLQWAHGSAAKFQARAQTAAVDLGQDFVEDLAADALTVVVRKIRGRDVLRLYRKGIWICSASVTALRLTNLRSRCVCQRGHSRRPTTIRSCGNHASAALSLLKALYEQELAERSFWRSFKGSQCCGSMDNCPLATA